jgi:hypothetical protein
MAAIENAHQPPPSLLQRIERLESQNARLKKAAAVTVLALATIILLGQGSQKGREVEAQSFVLKDADGAVRARWETKGHEVLFRLFDTKERIRTELMVADTGAFVTLGDATGRPRAIFGVQGREGLEETTLALSDKNGKSMVLLTVGANYSGLKLSDGQDKLATSLLVTPLGSSIGFYDPTGTGRAQLGFAAGEPSLLLYGKDGKVTWHTP